MNPSSDLQALMALDALGEATPEQQAELRRHLAADTALAGQHAGLHDIAVRMEEVAVPLSPPVPLPASVLAQFEDTRTRALAKATASQAHADGAANVVTFADAARSLSAAPPTNTRVRQSRGMLQMLAWAAVIALLAVPVAWWLIPHDQTTVATASPALAPRGETGMTQPTMVWDNAPDQEYDVWILPDGADQKDAKALFVANKVRSPLQFAALKPGPANESQDTALKPDARYLALVCLAGKGRMAGVTVPFETAPAALGAPPAFSDAATALALARRLTESGRSSDALMVIAGLPPEMQDGPEVTELAAEIRKSLQ